MRRKRCTKYEKSFYESRFERAVNNQRQRKIFVTRTEIVDRSDAYADTEKYSLYVRDISNVLIIFTYKAATESLEFDALAEQILSTFTLNK